MDRSTQLAKAPTMGGDVAVMLVVAIPDLVHDEGLMEDLRTSRNHQPAYAI